MVIPFSEDHAKCSGCESAIQQGSKFCNNCGMNIGTSGAQPGIDRPTDSGSPAGFGRTLSMELFLQQEKRFVFEKIDALVECCHFSPGEVIIKKGDHDRNLYLLTEGRCEVVSVEDDHDILLNEVSAPYILGDISYILGTPRTATVRAGTNSTIYILNFEKMQDTIGPELPSWFRSLLSSFVGGIKSMNSDISSLQQEIQQLRQELAKRTI